jgi:hypothetical protein
VRDGANGFCRRVLIAAGPVSRTGAIVREVSRKDPTVCWEREVLRLFSVNGEDD